jgi:hypothetical protein
VVRLQPTMPQHFSYTAMTTVLLEESTDEGAPGAAITVELCGHWQHKGLCRWPHRTDISRRGKFLDVQTYFEAPSEEEAEVRGRIQSALAKGRLVGEDGSVTSWEVLG